MSVTVTENPITYNTLRVLADYDLHHSENDNPQPAPNAHPLPPQVDAQSLQNPPNWPDDARRVPAYRPVNPQLDQSQRRVYQNPIEMVFITLMFTGVFEEALGSAVWRATVGKINPYLARFRIGGEF